MIALTILSFAVLAVTYSGVAGQQQVDYADDTARAVRLARDLTEEIVSKAYSDPGSTPLFGPEAGEVTRQSFDDVDDYHNYAEAAGQLKDFTGTAYAAAEQRFTRTVTVVTGGQTVAAFGLTVPGVTVTVRVQRIGGAKCEVTRFIPEP